MLHIGIWILLFTLTTSTWCQNEDSSDKKAGEFTGRLGFFYLDPLRKWYCQNFCKAPKTASYLVNLGCAIKCPESYLPSTARPSTPPIMSTTASSGSTTVPPSTTLPTTTLATTSPVTMAPSTTPLSTIASTTLATTLATTPPTPATTPPTPGTPISPSTPASIPSPIPPAALMSSQMNPLAATNTSTSSNGTMSSK